MECYALIPIFLQDTLNRHREREQSNVKKLKAQKGYCTKSEMLEIKKKVKETEQLIRSLPKAPALSSRASVAAQTEEFKCLVCLTLPPAQVFICTDCEGTLCESCKTQLERTHDQSGRVGPLSCPQCRAVFITPGNPIRSRKTERLIQNLLQQWDTQTTERWCTSTSCFPL